MCSLVVLVKSGETAGDSTNEFDKLLLIMCGIITFETYVSDLIYVSKSFVCFVGFFCLNKGFRGLDLWF